MSLSNLVKWCLENIDDQIEKICQDVITVKFNPLWDKNKRKLYTYFRRKYDFETAFDGENTDEFPAGSSLILNGDDSYYAFPDDEVTDLLNKYNCNKLHTIDNSNTQVYNEAHVSNKPSFKTEFIRNKTFVLTGYSEYFSRTEFYDFITSQGGNMSMSVSSKTDCLVIPTSDIEEGTNSKYLKAKKLNLLGSHIRIISDDDLYTMITGK